MFLCLVEKYNVRRIITAPISCSQCSELQGQVWKWKSLSRVRLFATLWTIQSMEFCRPEYWSGLPCFLPGDLPDPGIEPGSLAAPALQADSFTTEPLGKLSTLKHNFRKKFSTSVSLRSKFLKMKNVLILVFFLYCVLKWDLNFTCHFLWFLHHSTRLKCFHISSIWLKRW